MLHSPIEKRDASRDAFSLAVLITAQMLPATLIAPAIRPLFAEFHGGAEGPMHAFMAINMLGGILAAPLIARTGGRKGWTLRLAAALTLLDGILLGLMTLPMNTNTLLGLRLLDGAAHVSASTLLMAEAATFRAVLGSGRAMGLAGGGVMMAIAFGSAIGGLLLKLGTIAPFAASAILSLLVSARLAARPARPRPSDRPAPAGSRPSPWKLAAPISAAFIERFAIGCLIVTFSLFAHRGHGLTDSAIGLLFAAFTVPFALLMYPIGRLAERIPRAGLLGAGGLLYAASLLALGYAPGPLLWLPMLAGGCASALMFSPTLSYAAAIAGAEGRASAMAWISAAGCLGMLLGPAAAGITSAAFAGSNDPLGRYRAVFTLAAASVLLWTLLASRWLFRRLQSEHASLAAQEDTDLQHRFAGALARGPHAAMAASR